MRNLRFLPAMLGGIIALSVILFVGFHFVFIDFSLIGGGTIH